MKDLETHFNEITAGAPTGTLRDGSPCAYMFDGHIILNTGYIIYKSPGVYFETTDPELFRAFLRLRGFGFVEPRQEKVEIEGGLENYALHNP